MQQIDVRSKNYISDYMKNDNGAIGTKLRRVLQMLDGDVAQVYAGLSSPFRPRFYPVFQSLSIAERTVSLTERCLEEAARLRPVWKRIEGAARQLDTELPVPLENFLDGVIEALERRPFQERIG